MMIHYSKYERRKKCGFAYLDRRDYKTLLSVFKYTKSKNIFSFQKPRYHIKSYKLKYSFVLDLYLLTFARTKWTALPNLSSKIFFLRIVECKRRSRSTSRRGRRWARCRSWTQNRRTPESTLASRRSSNKPPSIFTCWNVSWTRCGLKL